MGYLSTKIGAATVILLFVAVAIAGCSIEPPNASAQEAAGPAAQASRPTRPIPYLGVYEPTAPHSYAGVTQFAKVVGRQPNIVLYYSSWGQPFATAFAQTAASNGALTFVQIDPYGVTLAQVAAGASDSYLISFADQVAAFGHPVAIGFGHEMNGFWYPWGYGHTDPAVFVAAWRHVVTVFRDHGARDVKWVWTINRTSSLTPIVHDWWPGSAYVTWVGVNGYYYRHSDTFSQIFKPVIAAVRRFTDDPVLIAETAVGPAAGQSRGIADLFAGVRAEDYLGLVWFDQTSRGDLYHQDWRLEDNPAAVAAFRAALNR